MTFHSRYLFACLVSAWVSAHADSIVIGAEDDAAPWSYADGSGYANDLVRSAYEAVGWQVQYAVLPYARCKLLAEEGRLVACFSASNTAETTTALQFPSMPIFSAHNVLFARADSTLTGCDPKDWKRMITVAFVNEYEYIDAVDALQQAGNIRAEVVQSETASLRMLQSGRVDAALITVDEVKRMDMLAVLAGVSNAFKRVCHFGAQPAYLAFSRQHPKAAAALDAFNRGMAILLKSGAVKRLQAQWAKKALDREAVKAH